MPFSFGPFPQEKKSFVKRRPFLSSFIALVLIGVSTSYFSQEDPKPQIGVVPINGIILESEDIIRKLRELEYDPNIRGIVLRINSPGGAVAPSQEIYTELLRLKKKKLIYTLQKMKVLMLLVTHMFTLHQHLRALILYLQQQQEYRLKLWLVQLLTMIFFLRM